MSSSIAGLIGLMVMLLPLVAAVTAIVTGVMARKQIARSDGALKGRGMALAGIICGSITLLGAMAITAVIVVAVAAAAPDIETMDVPARAVEADVVDEEDE